MRAYNRPVGDNRWSRRLGAFPYTSGLLALLVAMFAIEVLEGGSRDAATLLRLGANYPPFTVGGEWWRLVTATLLHIGLLHLAMNGFALLQLGRLAELSFGGPATIVLFVFTGVCGSALSLLTASISAGASGAIFGILGALLSFFLRHRERLTPTGKALLKQLAIWAAFILAYSFLVPGIDLLGHLGGFLAGLAVGWALPPFRGRAGRAATAAALASVGILAAAIAAMALSQAPAPERAEAVARGNLEDFAPGAGLW